MAEKKVASDITAPAHKVWAKSLLFDVLAALRPKHWVKNCFVFAALIFSGELFALEPAVKTISGFLAFCILSSAAYVFNDLMDRNQDRSHPQKQLRPIASGRVSPGVAMFLFVLLGGGGIVSAWAINSYFGIIAIVYMLLNVGYSLYLKHIVIIDVMMLSSGFMLRLFAGAAILGAALSSWFIICTILLSLFLGLVKRRQEIVIMGERAVQHRSVLSHYSPYVLDQMIAVVTASTLISYAIYTISEETIRKFHTKYLMLTLPFVLYGIFRYLYLIHQQGKGESPTTLMLEDIPMMINSVFYILTVIVIIYAS